MLWNRSLVMRDIETETLWSHLLGRGMRGELEGVELEMLPASMTTWGEWRARHPDTTLLAMSRTTDRYDEGAWKSPHKFVYGIPLGPGLPSPAVGLRKLQNDTVVMVKLAEATLVVAHEKEGGSVKAFDAKVDGKTLTFSASGERRMTDSSTSSEWDVVTGEALSGPLKGKSLKEIPGTVSFLKAWNAFYPDDEVVNE